MASLAAAEYWRRKQPVVADSSVTYQRIEVTMPEWPERLERQGAPVLSASLEKKL